MRQKVSGDEALARLGVDQSALIAAPSITPQLRMIAKTMKGDSRMPYGPGSDVLTSWPDYLQSSDDVEARRVRETYFSMPAYMRRSLTIEAFCVAAGVSPLRILEILTATIVRLGAQASRVIAAVNHPRVVAKTIEMALTDGGVEDRNVLHKHTGFLPTPSGPRTSVVVTQTANATAQAAAVPAPPPEATIRRLADRFNLARAEPPALPAETVAHLPEPIATREAELVESEYLDEGESDVREGE